MTEPPDHLPLAAEFPPATRAQWLKLVEAVLKGAPFDQKLVAQTYDALRIEPLYQRAADARPIAGRGPGAGWTIMQRIDHPDPAAANAEVLHELDNGSTGLALIPAGAVGAYGYGLTPSADAVERVLAGVHLDAGIAFAFDFSPQAMDMPLALAALVERRGIAPGAVDIRFGFDPLGALAFAGQSPVAWRDLAPRTAKMVADLAGRGFKGPFATADGRIVHNAGGSEAQELAFVLSVAVAYLRAFEAGGIALGDARRMISFRLAADADQFLTIAKFRALRKLWARVEQACGLASAPAFIAAETAWRMMTKRDPYVNMLRATIAVVSAGLGGADAVSVLPYSAAIGLPDRFARRIARNTQLILLEESHLAKVADPAAGSGGIEDLTDKLCRAAWTLFQEIEAAGGAAAALDQGLIQKKVAVPRAKRQAALASGQDALVGTTIFSNPEEPPVAVVDVAPPPAPPPLPAAVTVEPLTPMRLAEPFE